MTKRSVVAIAGLATVVVTWVLASAFGPDVVSAGTSRPQFDTRYEPGAVLDVVFTVENSGFVPVEIRSMEPVTANFPITAGATVEALGNLDPDDTIGAIDEPVTLGDGAAVLSAWRANEAEIRLFIELGDGACADYDPTAIVTFTEVIVDERSLGLTWTRKRSLSELTGAAIFGIDVSFDSCS